MPAYMPRSRPVTPGLALADHDLGRGEVVLHRRRLAQELRVEGGLVEPPRPLPGRLGQGRQDQPLHGPGRDRAAEHQQQRRQAGRAAARQPAELARHGQQVREVELAVGARGGADADDGEVEPVEPRLDARPRGDAAVPHPGLEQLGDAGLEHGRAPLGDGADLVRRDVDAVDVVAGLARQAAVVAPT
jgi:hypothetical protein